jgi:amino acid adenylation domain-containing protein
MRLEQLLEASARRSPWNPAVVEPGKRSASYRELDAIANGVRDALVRAGVAADDRVGICAPKTIATVASIFGVLKAGAAYVPVDPRAPFSRNAYIFEDCTTKAIIVEQQLAPGLLAELAADGYEPVPELAATRALGVDFALLKARERDPVPPLATAASIAYILYTSGSTGRPKGVIHTHASALSFIDWCSEEFAPRDGDRFSSHAPFHFDLSILDIYVSLKHGAAVVLFGEELGKQPAGVVDVIAQEEISVWYSTPSTLRLLSEFGRLARYRYPRLRTVIFAGEVFPIKHLRALQDAWPGPAWYNLYGPTETNVCTYHRLPQELPRERTEPVPIGRPCSGDRTYVAKPGGLPAAPGEEGELYVSGGSVMLGYWNLPEQNAAAFHVDEAGTRWYRTGDIVREVDGELVYLGRRDRMVKRRGYRVELGEIETALYRHPSITEAAVIATAGANDDVVIKAFVVWAGEQRPSTIGLKQYCSDALPLYMVPDRFSVQTELPKTSTDKIDYQRLKQLQ